jgi:TP901 family phage tail tape measure protein
VAFKAGAIYGEARLDTTKWQGGLSRMTKGVGIAMAAITAAFIAGVVQVTKKADEFQRAMSNVASIVDTSAINMQELTMSLFQLDPALGETTDLTNGLYQAFSAGAETAEEAMDVTIQSATFAKAALTDTKTAVDVLTTAINAYGKENMDASTASDIFFKTVQLGKITGEELSATIGQSIPLFASTGIELQELAAGMAAMTKQGVSASNATTQLNAIVNAFLKPSEAMKDALEDIGVESGAAFLETEGLAGALSLLEQQTGGNASELGKLIPNIRGMRGAMALTGTGGQEFARVLREMESATGATQEAFEKQEKTFDTLRSALGRVQIVTGNIAKHFVDQIAVGATTAANSMLQFIMSSQGMNFVANAAGFVSGAFSTIKEIADPLFAAFKESISTVWGAIETAIEKVFGNANEASGAFNLLAGVTNLLSSAMIIAGKAINTVITTISDLIVALRESASTVGLFFQALINPTKWGEVGKQASKAGDAFANLGKGVIENVSDLVTTVIDEFSTFGERTEQLATDLEVAFTVSSQRAAEGVKANWAEMLTGMEPFIEGIQQQFITAHDAIVEDTDDTTTELEATWEDYFSSIQTGFSTMTNGIANITNQSLANEEARIRRGLYDQITALEEARDQGIITEEQFDEQKKELEDKANERLNENAQKQFEANKKNRIANVWIDTASAIQGFWSSSAVFGPIAGPIYAGIMTGLVTASAIAQSALIGKQVFVPSLQAGGTVSGIAEINEAGGEIVHLPDNSLVIPNDVSRQIAANVGGNIGNTYNVSFAGANITDNISLQKVVDAVVTKLGRQMRLAG